MERETILNFSKKIEKEKVQKFYEQILSIITHSLSDMLEDGKNQNLNFDYDTTRIFPNGDYTNDTFIDETGELEIVIASSNSQLILNNEIFVKEREKYKKKPKKLATISNDGTFDNLIMKFIDYLVPYFDETTLFLLTNDGLKIMCLEEFGFKVLVRFATFKEDDKDAILSFWDPMDHLLTPVDLFLYNDNMERKDAETKGNYKKLVRIFKNIRKTILLNKWTTNSNLNKYFIELITYNIPSTLMLDDDIEIVFNKAVNYLANCNIYKFRSFDGGKLNDFHFAKINTNNIKNFVNYLYKA